MKKNILLTALAAAGISMLSGCYYYPPPNSRVIVPVSPSPRPTVVVPAVAPTIVVPATRSYYHSSPRSHRRYSVPGPHHRYRSYPGHYWRR